MTSEPIDALSEFACNAGSTNKELEKAQHDLGFALPAEYLAFMRMRNGGEGFIGENYIIIWKAKELAKFNQEYEVYKYAPGLVLFGSNGGGEGFGFDTRSPDSVLMVPFIGMELAAAREVAKSFDQFISVLAQRPTDELF